MAEKIRVLFVDDEHLLLDVGKEFLERSENITVFTAESASRAFELLKKHTIDAIVSDYQMPEMNGIQFLKAVRKEYPALPFIIFAGKGSDEITIAAFESGADYYVKKGGAPTKQFAELAHRIKLAFKRRQTEERSRESEKLFREIFNNANDAIFLHDLNPEGPGKYILVNDVAIRGLGYTREEFMTMSPHDLVPEPVMQGVLPETIKMLTGHGHATFESVHQRKDGSTYPVEVSSHTFTFNNRLLILSIVRDISGRKLAEENLRESEEKFRTLAGSTPVAIMIYQGDHLVYVNPAGEWMSGYSSEDLYAMNYWDLIDPEFRQLVRDRGKQRQAGEHLPYSYDIRIIAKDGSAKWVSMTGNRIQFSGKPSGLISAVDITERKRAENTIALANRKLTLMNDVTYQDIQNKVTGLRGYVDLSKDATTDAERLSFAKKEEQILADIHHMIKNCKEYEEMGVTQSRWIPLEQSIQIAASLVSPGPGISVLTDLHGLELFSDPLIEKIFSNLIDNAVRYGKHLTRIRFSCEKMQDGLALICEDDGAGIPEEKKKGLFKRETGTSMGFGLFFVSEYLAINGMTICETGTPGKGARFEITVPKGMWRFGK